MPLEISSWAVAEKNKTSQGNCWLLAMEITIPSETEKVRVVANTADITWAGHSWMAFPFTVDEIGETSKGEVPSVTVSVGNENLLMGYYIDKYNTWIKTNGFHPVIAKIMVINSGNLSNTTPEVSYIFQLEKPSVEAEAVVFTLGAANPYRKRYPETRIIPNQCQHETKFKGIQCGYSGTAYSTCGMTFKDCKDRGNTGRFGGFPGAGSGAIRI